MVADLNYFFSLNGRTPGRRESNWLLIPGVYCKLTRRNSVKIRKIVETFRSVRITALKV